MRQEEILWTLDKLGFATRSQLQQIHDLGSMRNANRILSNMREYLNFFRLFENVYYLNKNGIDFLGLEKEPLKKNMQIEHYLMRNDMYIYYDFPKDWQIEKPIHFKARVDIGGGIFQTKERTIIPDAQFTVNSIYHFLEVDNQQQMKENRKKIELYKELTASIKETYKQTPTIIFYTSSENRKKKLDEWCDRAGLYYHVFTRKDI